MILVVGAAGLLGSEIVRQLRVDGKPVRAFVRTTSASEKVERLKCLGAVVIEGNLLDKTSLTAACQGITTVITTATTTASQTPDDSIPKVDQFGALQLVEAAMEAKVSHFIYVSTRMTIPDCALKTAKRTLEERIMGSKMAYTLLRPSFFMEVWLSPLRGFDYPNAQARIYGSGENPISWISVVDVAHFAVMAIDEPAARNTVLELGGAEKLSPHQAIQLFEQASGKSFQVEAVPVEAIQAQRGATCDPLQHTLASLMLAYANGDPVEMDDTLQTFPLHLASVQDYAARVAAVSIRGQA